MTDTKAKTAPKPGTRSTGKSTASVASSSAKATSTPAQERLEKVLEAYAANQAILFDVFESARQRSIRTNDAIIGNFTQAQEDMLDLVKALSQTPRDYRGNFSAVLGAITESQTRSLDLFKSLLAEQVESREKSREVMKSLYQTNKDSLTNSTDLFSLWGEGNPIGESWLKTLDTFKDMSGKIAA